MPGSSLSGVSRRTLTVALGLCCVSVGTAQAQSWRSPLLGRELVIVEKTRPGDPDSARTLPEAVRAKLGPDFVEYEAFVAARLPAAAAKELIEAALAERRGVFRDTRPPAVLPFQTFHPEDIEERTETWRDRRLRPMPVPGLFLIRFAFPFLSEWTDSLRACGADSILYHGSGVLLMRARNLGVIQSCPVARYLSWADAFRVTDRTSPQLLEAAGLELKPYSLVFAPGTDLDTALSELPAIVETGGHMVWDDGTLSLAIRAGRPELEDLAQTSLHLLAIHEAEGEPQPSDERQGQILAGNYVGYPGAVAGAVTTPGYLTWLANRGLRTTTNPQTVAVFDTGYDDGSGSAGTHHPDLEGPERLIATEGDACFVFNRTTPIDDTRGHGTAVAGIIAGNGAAASPVGAKDAQNFYLGTGIAPDVKLVAVQVIDSNSETDCTTRTGFGDPPDNIGNAIAFSRVKASGADKALIANHSWNLSAQNTNYTNMAKLFDERVLDAVPAKENAQVMTTVVSAGNSGPGLNTILSPATAKNVITVGSTQNYRPAAETGAPANSCGTFTEDATNIALVSNFSSRGVDFRPYNLPVVPPQLHERRIKPDLVAPGVRVTSTVPDASSTYFCPSLCMDKWPAGQSYSFGTGTSFAAPAVTGVAAHARKWFMDRGVLDPSPSLIKAALIATATDLGPATAGDHRPSNRFGWGRVDLNRLTDPSVARFYFNENTNYGAVTGSDFEWRLTIDSSSRPTFIVLAWSDPASSVGATSQVPLVNDLHLVVEMIGANVYWRGNNFNENIDGNDNGYSSPYALGGAPLINDTMNNVEAIFIPTNMFWSGQKVTLRVIGMNVHSPTQKFSIYAYNVRPGS
jgi:hypothetical protein